MFETMLIERRRRAIIMRENAARRMLAQDNPQFGPFRPTDICEDSHEDDDDDDAYEPTGSVAPAASDAPTALLGPASYLPPLPGDIEELSPELWADLIVQELSMSC